MSRWPEAVYTEADVIRDPCWKLVESTWVGTLGYAVHYMARIQRRTYVQIKGLEEDDRRAWTGKEVCEAEYLPDADQARRLSSPDFTHRPEWWSTRFFSEEAAREAAIACFHALAQVGEWLEDDFWEVDEPHPKVLAGERPDDVPDLWRGTTTNLEPPEVGRLLNVTHSAEELLGDR